MDKKNLITALEIVGWTHPSEADSKKAVKWLNSLEFDKSVYPEHLMVAKKPPACMFVPEPKLLHIMIETLIKSSDKDHLLAKFCDQEILYTPPDESIQKTDSLNYHRMKDGPGTIEFDDSKLSKEDLLDDQKSKTSTHGIGTLKTTIPVENT